MISPKTGSEFWLIDSETRRPRYFRLLGVLPLLFFLAQGVHYWKINELGHMLWICNIGNLMLAIGLFMNHAALIRIVSVWTVPGLIVWFVYVVLAWGVFLSSSLAHVGGLAVAMIAVRRVGMDRSTWIYSLAGYLVVQLVSRVLTPVALNVNLSQTVYGGWESAFDAYWKFWIVITLVATATLYLTAFVLRRIWPSESDLELATVR